jgi:hypothetical protein
LFYPAIFFVTLKSPIGFRRFIVDGLIPINEVKRIAIKIDKDMVSPIKDYCKKFSGVEYIPITSEFLKS